VISISRRQRRSEGALRRVEECAAPEERLAVDAAPGGHGRRRDLLGDGALPPAREEGLRAPVPRGLAACFGRGGRARRLRARPAIGRASSASTWRTRSPASTGRDEASHRRGAQLSIARPEVNITIGTLACRGSARRLRWASRRCSASRCRSRPHGLLAGVARASAPSTAAVTSNPRLEAGIPRAPCRCLGHQDLLAAPGGAPARARLTAKWRRAASGSRAGDGDEIEHGPRRAPHQSS
jgi:hypothetical protein